MKKIITPFNNFPNELKLANGESAKRYYLILPLPCEVQKVQNERIDDSSVEHCIDTLIISLWQDSSDFIYFKFGCGFFNRKIDNQKLYESPAKFFRFVDLINKEHYSDKGKELIKNYYWVIFHDLKVRFLDGFKRHN